MADIAAIRRGLADPEWVAQRLGLERGSKIAGGITVRCPWHDDRGRANCALTRRSDGTLSAHCFSCQAGGDVLHLVGAASGITPGWYGGQQAPIREDLAKVIAACEDLMGGAAPPPPPRQRPRREEGYPPPPSVRFLWGSAPPCAQTPGLAEQLAARGLSIADVAPLAKGLAPSTGCPPWACQGSARARKPWGACGYRLLLPMWDGRGEMVVLHARRFGGPGDERKGVSPTGYSHKGAVLACPLSQRMLRGEAAPSSVIIGEGVPDFLVLASQGSGAAVLGVLSGSWCEAIAARIPEGAGVVVWTHTDAQRNKLGQPIEGAGQKYAGLIARSLHPRCSVRVVVQARPERGKAPDANDLLLAGGRAAVQLVLDSARPWR